MATINQENFRQYLWDHVVPHLIQMAREFLILKALEGSEVPVPKVFHLCESGAIFGAPWFCAEFLEGVVYRQPSLKNIPSHMRGRVYKSAVTALVSIHKADWRKKGLDAICGGSKVEPYFERQLRTLLRTAVKQQESLSYESLKGIHELVEGLGRVLKSGNVPPGLTLVHGDYKLDNIIFKHSPCDEISGIIDWELSTIGHPMVDVCVLLAPFYLPRCFGLIDGMKDMDLSLNGLPSIQEILNMYHDASGCDENYLEEESLSFFMAFLFFKYAVITHGVKMRMQLGTASSGEASEVAKLPELFIKLGFTELQKLQTTRISEEGNISSSHPKPHFRAVIFDVGGVLCASPVEAIAKHECVYGFQPGVISKAMASSSITRKLWRGELALNRKVLNEWSEEIIKHIAASSCSSSTNCSDGSGRSFHSSSTCLHGDVLIRDIIMCINSPISEMLSCVSTLLLMGIKVAILSNDFCLDRHLANDLANEMGINILDKNENVYVQLKRLGVKEQAVLRSSQIKTCKPDPDAYMVACSAIGVLPTETIMCDDLRTNLVTASNLGMGTVLFGTKKDKRKEIGELMNLLNRKHHIVSKL